jgi:hypothetical protein
VKIWYAISNNGDGSNSVYFAKKEFDVEKMEEADAERWASGDGFQMDSFEISGDNLAITGLHFEDEGGYYYIEKPPESEWTKLAADNGFYFVEEVAA